MARATHVLKARKAVPASVCGIEGGIKKGDSYYWWKFRRGGKHYSKTPPRRSQLTQSAFYGSIYDLEDSLAETEATQDSISAAKDDAIAQLEELRDQCQESLDNMPESLQQGPTGELLQERIDAMEQAISEFEDLEVDEPSDDDLEIDDEREEGESKDDFEARVEEERKDAIDEYWRGKLEELQGITIEAP